jgi:transcription elongation factor Elf1
MGKRKGNKKPIKKKVVPKLEVVFDCPYCNNNQCIEIDL